MSWGPEDLEEVPCDLCGTGTGRPAHRRPDGMQVEVCSTCGLAFLNPRPTQEAIAEVYGRAYFDGERDEEGIGGLRLSEAPVAGQALRPVGAQDWCLGRLTTLWEASRSPPEVLEVGCAYGDLLEEMGRRGYRAEGIEISEHAAATARRRGLVVESGTVEAMAPGRKGRYGAIAALEVLEHVPSPVRFLEACREMLRPGGLLLLSTPNYAMARLLGGEWKGLRTSFEHIYFFTARDLRAYARRVGFRVETEESLSLLLGISEGWGRSWGHWRRRMAILRYLVAEIGLVRGVRQAVRRDVEPWESPTGHTLLVTLRRVEPVG